MDDALIAELRAFNRFYTQLIGLLDEHLEQSPFSLAEARVLHEIATRGHTTGTELAAALDLDRAYLSRILKGFAAQELIVISPIPGDRRQNAIALSRDGDRAAAALAAGADAAMARLVAKLGDTQRARLRAALLEIRTLLGDDVPAMPVTIRPPRIGEVALVAARQAVLYAEEYGWDGSYEGLAAEIVGRFLQEYDAAWEACFIAEYRGALAGSVFVVDAGKGTAQLRLLYVEPEARGLGVGRQLVAQVVDFSRARGYRKIRLWTQSILTGARRIYAEAGFKLVESAPHRSFGVDLVGEYWELELQATA